jgi:probable rRNA maturation factor
MALKINLINKQKLYKISKKQICDLCVFVLKSQGIKSTEVSLLFTDDKNIAKLNKKFRRKDKATDVLSFYEAENINKALSVGYLGDVAVSVETARRQAKEYRETIIHEIMLYVVHGLLHLLGNKDYTKKEKEAMDTLQEALLSQYEKKNNNR